MAYCLNITYTVGHFHPFYFDDPLENIDAFLFWSAANLVLISESVLDIYGSFCPGRGVRLTLVAHSSDWWGGDALHLSFLPHFGSSKCCFQKYINLVDHSTRSSDWWGGDTLHLSFLLLVQILRAQNVTSRNISTKLITQLKRHSKEIC